MSKQDAKNLFKDGVTTWEEKTMHDYTDILYEEIAKAKDYIIEVGSNENGSWEKWASGKLVCTQTLSLSSGTGTNWGGLYYIYTSPEDWTYPVPFVDRNISITGQPIHFGGILIVNNIQTTMAIGIGIYRPISSFGSNDTKVPLTAIGRWK